MFRRHVVRKQAGRAKRPAVILVLVTLAATLLAGAFGSSAAPMQAAAQATPLPAQPAGGQLEYGMVMALLGNNSNVRNMGYNWVSYGIYWYESEPTPGNFQWANVNNIVNAAQNANINVMIRVHRPPQWARDPVCAGVDTCPPRDPAEFGNFASALANHVRNTLRPTVRVAYEIWNEPNIDFEWGGICPQPERYAQMLRAVYPRIKAADPSAQVVAGAVTTVGQIRASVCFVDDIEYIQRMYAAGAGGSFDILSDHPYGFASPPEADPISGPNALVFRRAERHRQIMVQNGDGHKQIWATEMGWAMDPRTLGLPCEPPDWHFIHTPQQQADYMVRAHTWARSFWPWMGAMFIFNYDFNEAPWYDTCHPFRHWAVKGRPAESALRQMVSNPPPTYTPVPMTPTPRPDEPPVISAVRYSSLNFGNAGGTLVVEVDASDDDATPIDTVEAVVQFPNGSTQLFVFSLVSGTNRSGTWRTSVPISSNPGPNNQQYIVSPYVVETFPARRVTNAPPQTIQVSATRFWDVPADMWAYEFVEYLAARGVIGGYADGSFRPNNPATRGQLTKIVVLGFNMPQVTPAQATFTDVPAGSTFYTFVETAVAQGLVGGYPCGGPGEPCDPQRRPYFRPNANVTRGQIAKIVVLAADWTLANPPSNTFADVPRSSAFFPYIETAVAHSILGGYHCGGPGEPCDPQQRPYFRPGNNATRAQISKMVYLAVTEVPPTPTPQPTSTRLPTSTPVPTSTVVPSAAGTITPTPSLTPPSKEASPAVRDR